MSEKSDPSFQKARDDALRALVKRGNLTPDQISAIKLNQVHLTTGTLVIEPDEFGSSGAASQSPIRLKLDSAMQRALIAWLVVRPDGPNDHLFPGAGIAGLDVKSINQVVAAEKPAEASRPKESTAEVAPPLAESKKKPEVPPQPVTPRPAMPEKDKGPAPPPPPVITSREGSEAVPLDEIESLRQRLAETYDAWAPAVTAGTVRRAADKPPSPPTEAGPTPSQVDTGAPSEPAIIPPPRPQPAPRPEEISVAPAEPKPAPGSPPSGPQETGAAEPMPEPVEEVHVVAPAPAPPGGASPEQRGWQKLSQKKVTVKLTYRNAVIGGLALLLVICCVGLGVIGGSMLGPEGTAGLLAGGAATETQTPTLTAPPVTATPSPAPTATVTMTPTSAPSPTPVPSPVPTETQGPTPTPVIIVVTATPTPEPSPTNTPVPTDTPEGGVPPEPAPTETPGFEYPAPVLIWPENASVVPGVINILQWEPVGPLDDDEWYAVRLIYRHHGELAYAGDRVKIAEWRVPDRLYYASDGPELKYTWYVFVERDNPDGSTTQLSPESERFEFRWE